MEMKWQRFSQTQPLAASVRLAGSVKMEGQSAAWVSVAAVVAALLVAVGMGGGPGLQALCLCLRFCDPLLQCTMASTVRVQASSRLVRVLLGVTPATALSSNMRRTGQTLALQLPMLLMGMSCV